MTRLFQVNDSNDIFARGGRVALANGQQAVLQHCEHAIKAQLGEMVYDYDRGVNTTLSVWDGSPNLLSFEASARAQLERIPDVIAVEDFQTTLNGHTLTYQALIRTVFGDSQLLGDLPGGFQGG